MFLYLQFLKNLDNPLFLLLSNSMCKLIENINYKILVKYEAGEFILSSLTEDVILKQVLDKLDIFIRENFDQKYLLKIFYYIELSSEMLINKLSIEIYKNTSSYVRKLVLDYLCLKIDLDEGYVVEFKEQARFHDTKLFSAQYNGISYDYSVNEFIIKLIKTVYGKSTWRVIEKI